MVWNAPHAPDSLDCFHHISINPANVAIRPAIYNVQSTVRSIAEHQKRPVREVKVHHSFADRQLQNAPFCFCDDDGMLAQGLGVRRIFLIGADREIVGATLIHDLYFPMGALIVVCPRPIGRMMWHYGRAGTPVDVLPHCAANVNDSILSAPERDSRL